jgi:carotenoid cleavage dioxygenase
MAAAAEELPFHLKGNFAPVQEEVTAFDLPVEGTLPPELRGLYVRNGSNPPTGRSAHWFLAPGMVHGVRLEEGRAAWYRNRWVRTPRLEDPERASLSEDGVFDRRVSYANTHVLRHAGRILALEEASFPYVLDGELGTLGCFDYEGRLTTAMTAHPKICPDTGEMLFFGYGQLPPYLTYHRVSPDGRLVQSEEITVAGPTMMHDFAVTRRHALFMDLPVVFDMDLALRGEMPFHWSDDYPARMGVMPREGRDADVRWFEVDPCYVFHTLNAWDDGDEVVLDGCRITDLWRQPGDFSGSRTTLHRWRFDLASGAVREETLDDRGQDFPRVADRTVGQRHRFGYTLLFGEAEAPGEPALGRLLQIDFERGTRREHDFGPGVRPGEPVFVPAPDGRGDDEGFVLSYVHDERLGRSALVVLDAQRFDGPPLARVELPQRVPFGFHGSWLPDEA